MTGRKVKKSASRFSVKTYELLYSRSIAPFFWGFVFLLFTNQRPEATFSGESAFSYLEKQCSFGPRNPGSQGHRACLQYLISEMKRYTPHVTDQQFPYFDSNENKYLYLSNVISYFPGSNPDGQKIMLAAHWDTRSIGEHDKDESKRNSPILGANDGASGV
ncbi:MAG: M28 family peptidase, partial [bacterium]|nr:M28 family peptidase [bacterium]